ncbi:hypothetical protein QJS10_CPA02g00916 [Acorus calamus]|uniref:Ribosome maturation protein SBDS n=1 Tax=Acorus calamus TaxID=4465 RepID=A0AAV9FCD1_ACOCL|nr:hypothetical protein QJS10_CPA02g00916 [Acorus calamus]
MSRSITQPIGQKRLTNVAVVRLKKCGIRFEIACYKNKVLSWRSGVEKDLDEVLQSQIVYSYVSKGVLAKTKELKTAFATDDQSKICLEILEKGELQVAGKERESQFQALEVIRELQKHFPIKRSPMRLRLVIPIRNFTSLMEKLNTWNAVITSKDESGDQSSVVFEMDPGFFRECDTLVRNLQGRLEILAMSVHMDGDAHVDNFVDFEDISSSTIKESNDSVIKLTERIQKQTIAIGNGNPEEKETKQNRCNTCDAVVGDSKQYREHFKSYWHKHNLRRKTRQLPPLTQEECLSDLEMSDSRADLKDYAF